MDVNVISVQGKEDGSVETKLNGQSTTLEAVAKALTDNLMGETEKASDKIDPEIESINTDQGLTDDQKREAVQKHIEERAKIDAERRAADKAKLEEFAAERKKEKDKRYKQAIYARALHIEALLNDFNIQLLYFERLGLTDDGDMYCDNCLQQSAMLLARIPKLQESLNEIQDELLVLDSNKKFVQYKEKLDKLK